MNKPDASYWKWQRKQVKALSNIKKIIKLADKWEEEQLMPASHIAISALKDIRKIVREELK